MTRAAESTHWYRADGEPQYEVEATKGGMRPATLRDARKLGLAPSVTAIIKSAAAPGLENWKIDQAILAALTLPRIDGESNDALLARIKGDSKEQAKKAAERGTVIHAAIQGHYEGKPPAEEYWPHVKACAQKIEEAYGKQEWIAEQSFAHTMGFGGKVDLHCPVAVVDVKSKEFADTSKPLAYDEHAIQLAAYRTGLGFTSAKAVNVFVSASVPGLVRVHEWPEEELARGWEMFCALFAYWKAKNKYDPTKRA